MTMLALMLAVGVAGAQQADPKPKPSTKYGGAGGATPAPKKSALEEALDLALNNNPDLRVAASKLALAEAELSKARLQVTQKVAAAYADVEVARATVKEVERQVARFRTLHQRGGIEGEAVSKAELQLVEAKAKLAAAERELAHLQGKGGSDLKASRAALADYYDRTGHNATANFYRGAGQEFRSMFPGGGMGSVIAFVDSGTVKPDGSDKLRGALQKPVTISGQKMTLSDYLALVKKTGGFGIQADLKDPAWKEAVDFDFKDVTVGGMLQFLEDSLPNHRIVVRHYGLLIATREKVPERALTLTAFLHAEGEKEKPKATPAGDRVEGKITQVDGKGLCTISAGRVAGLAKGHSLDVYRSAPTPKYLGRITVVEVTEDSSVCKTAEKMHGNIMAGDMVTTRLVER
jgi:hypothetical protein